VGRIFAEKQFRADYRVGARGRFHGSERDLNLYRNANHARRSGGRAVVSDAAAFAVWEVLVVWAGWVVSAEASVCEVTDQVFCVTPKT